MLTLTTPQIVSPTAGSATFDTTPQIGWTSDAAAASHEIWVSEIGATTQTVFRQTGIGTSTFSVPSTLNIAGHRVWVRSFDAAGQASAWSSSRDFLINSAVPTGLGTSAGQTVGSVSMSWAALPGAQSYTVWVSNSVQQIQLAQNVTGTSYSMAGLNVGENHRFWVQGKSADGTLSGWSTGFTFTPASAISQQTPQLGGPDSTVNTASVKLAWLSVPQAAGYTVWVSEIGAGQVMLETGLKDTSFRATELPRGKSYRYWVQAVDENGTLSKWSAARDFYLPVLAPTSTLNLTTDQTIYLAPYHVQGTRVIQVAAGKNVTIHLDGQQLPANTSKLIIGEGASVTIQGFAGSYQPFPIGEVLLKDGASLNVQDAILSAGILDFGAQARIRSQIPGLVSNTSVVAHRNKADSDYDDLPDVNEVLAGGSGTLSYKADSDNDLLTDGFEVKYGLDPWSPDDITSDADNDGLNLLDEQIFGTDPFSADTDGDGTSDAAEANAGGNPNDPSDGGILPAASEVVAVTLTVGDNSGSHNERWVLQVGGIRHQSPDFGIVDTATYKFKRGEEYDVRLVHMGSQAAQPDYDYQAQISTAGNSYVIDPDLLLGVFLGRGINRTLGLTATLVVPAANTPEIEVSGNGHVVRDGDGIPSDTSNGNGTDFGVFVKGYEAITRTFYVNNVGTAPLTIGEVTLPPGFSFGNNTLPATIAAGGSASFDVIMESEQDTGVKTGEIRIANNDADENPFNFAIKGVVEDPIAECACHNRRIVDRLAGRDVKPTPFDELSDILKEAVDRSLPVESYYNGKYRVRKDGQWIADDDGPE